LRTRQQETLDIDDVVAAVEEDIAFGRLGPRARLTEDEMMARFDVKRHVAREALTRLHHVGVVAKVPNRGAAVRSFTAQEVEQIYFMRAALQSVAAGLIPLPADRAIVERLRRIHAAHGLELQRGDLRAAYRLNNEFHDSLYGACGNPFLAESVRRFADMASAVRAPRIADAQLLARAREEHAAMIEALERGDRERLVSLCVEHINPGKQAYLAMARAMASAAPRRRGLG
jgi:DNA-binding GntR family transcriptional regulator